MPRPSKEHIPINRPVRLTKFQRFKYLPLELRSNIWELACSVPRNIDIYSRDIANDREDEYITYKYITTRSPPAVLHACQESRKDALKHYTLDFGTCTIHPSRAYEMVTRAKIYINWNVDCVVLMCPEGMNHLPYDAGYPLDNPVETFVKLLEAKGLRNLAVNVESNPEGSEAEHNTHRNDWAEEFLLLVPTSGTLQELTLFRDPRYCSLYKELYPDPKDSIVFRDLGDTYSGWNREVWECAMETVLYFSDEERWDAVVRAWFKSVKIKLKKVEGAPEY